MDENTLPYFCQNKSKEILQCKSTPHFLSRKYLQTCFMSTLTLYESLNLMVPSIINSTLQVDGYSAPSRYTDNVSCILGPVVQN